MHAKCSTIRRTQLCFSTTSSFKLILLEVRPFSTCASKCGSKAYRPTRILSTFLFSACSNLGDPLPAHALHVDFVKFGLEFDIYASTALVDMYGKLGLVHLARKQFDGWKPETAFIAGYAKHGESVGLVFRDAFEIYNLLDSNDMGATHRMANIEKHWVCRAGKLQEAHDLIRRMPMRPDSIVWGAMLGACCFHSNVELGRWDGVAKMRKIMRGSQITKTAGYSFMEEDNQVREFIVGGKSHPHSDQIYALLDDIHAKIELYTSTVDSITDDVWITVNL
ncbi:OLC1v1002539C1 [Oldenlandia corymbosa var. corymbosa]|uniref:OLC1v1002539C1 n=1 Tax=Oldenlandia corymbosa var. corymbosa TaxID=529605 RepID=A0AAV1D7X3_OLDCO|nr:OLC1v1002539C1 [Oldenlandia corymbosa var. corymbosa]